MLKFEKIIWGVKNIRRKIDQKNKKTWKSCILNISLNIKRNYIAC